MTHHPVALWENVRRTTLRYRRGSDSFSPLLTPCTSPPSPPSPSFLQSNPVHLHLWAQMTICSHGYQGAAAKAFSLSPLCFETMAVRYVPPHPPAVPHPSSFHLPRRVASRYTLLWVSGVSWQMLTEACTHTQNTLCFICLVCVVGTSPFSWVRVKAPSSDTSELWQ